MSKLNTTTLYWLRTADMSDIFTEGYVGVSTDPHLRVCNHLTGNANSKVLERAGVTRDEVIVEMWEIPFDTHALMERGLRPERNIGWNVCRGGEGQGKPLFVHRGKSRPNRGGITKI